MRADECLGRGEVVESERSEGWDISKKYILISQPIPLHEVQAREGKDGAIQLKVEFHRGGDTIGLK